jgi:hypothetical protein
MVDSHFLEVPVVIESSSVIDEGLELDGELVWPILRKSQRETESNEQQHPFQHVQRISWLVFPTFLEDPLLLRSS